VGRRGEEALTPCLRRQHPSEVYCWDPYKLLPAKADDIFRGGRTVGEYLLMVDDPKIAENSWDST